MIASEIALHRLHHQRLAAEKHARPHQVAAWFGAIQAQHVGGVKWALGLRYHHPSLTAVAKAIAAGEIVRTWLMRGTLQLVSAPDVRWMLALLAPRILAANTRRYRQLTLNETIFTRSCDVFRQTLQGGRQLTRADLMAALTAAGIATDGQRGYHILAWAALNQVICFGPSHGKQDTFVLLDEWVPANGRKKHQQALHDLAICYFRSHGPATLQDFVWWSGQKVSAAQTGLALAHTTLKQTTIDGETYYWLPRESKQQKPSPPTALLLPPFDEYYLGYRTRHFVLDPTFDKKVVSSNGIFRPMIVIDGQVIGTWKQTLRKDVVKLSLNTFRSLTTVEEKALHTAVAQYGDFLALSPEITFTH